MLRHKRHNAFHLLSKSRGEESRLKSGKWKAPNMFLNNWNGHRHCMAARNTAEEHSLAMFN